MKKQGLLEEIANTETKENAPDSTGGGQDIMARMGTASDADKKTILMNFLKSEVIAVLSLKPGHEILPSTHLISLGMDSLSALNFRNRLKKTLKGAAGKTIPNTLIFKNPTLEGVCNFLLNEFLK